MTRTKVYSAHVADELLARLAGGECLAEICRDDRMPAVRTVSHWKDADPAFKAGFARAREDGFDAIAARTRMTARGRGADAGGDSAGDVQRDKLIIETDLKLLARWDPKRYGDRLALAGDADSPLTVMVGDARAKLAKRLGVDPDAL